MKAQVDFIESRFKGKDIPADVIVHEHCGEAGAIGAALEAGRLWDNGRVSTFIGLDACANIQYKTTREEATRCYFCKNKCLRTFIDVKTNQIPADYKRPAKTKVPLEEGAQRLIIATCEKGTVENIEEMRGIKGELDKIKKANPNFVEIAAKQVFRVPDDPERGRSAAEIPVHGRAEEARGADEEARRHPHRYAARTEHVLAGADLHGYFAALGIKAENIVWSRLHQRRDVQGRRQARRHRPLLPASSVSRTFTTCYIAAHAKKPLDIIFFPMIDCLTSRFRTCKRPVPVRPWPPRPRL